MTEPTNTESLLDNIERKIVEICDSALSSRHQYLLSELGLSIGRESLLEMKEARGGKLADFIRQRLGNKYKIVETGIHRNILALTRIEESGIATLKDDEKGAIQDRDNVDDRAKVRYNHRFWAAFAVPLTKKIRYIDRKDLVFRDLESDDHGPSDSLRIAPEFIASANAEDRDTLIAKNIERWLVEQALSPREFVADARRPSSSAVSPPILSSNGVSVLQHLIESLDHKQLQSISLPLDIVSALLRKKV